MESNELVEVPNDPQQAFHAGIQHGCLTVASEAQRFEKVTNALDYTRAADMLKSVKGSLKSLDALTDALMKPHKDKIREIKDEFAESYHRLEKAEETLKAAIVAFDDAEEEKRKEEQRKADLLVKRQQETLRKRAEKAMEQGDEEKAIQLQERAEQVVAPVSQRAAPKVSGLNMRETYRIIVENENLVPITYKCVDTQKLQRVVSAARGKIDIPGVRIEVVKRAASTST